MQRNPNATLEEGLKFWLENTRDDKWRWLRPQPNTLPDQSEDGPWEGAGQPMKRTFTDIETGEVIDQDEDKKTGKGSDTKCWICGKPRSDHPGRRFCSKGDSTKGKGKSKGKRKSRGGGWQPSGRKGDGGGGKSERPAWMSGHASRLPPTKDHPNGKAICYDYHNPAGSTCRAGDSCPKAHACPVYLDNGSVCGKRHRIQDHK